MYARRRDVDVTVMCSTPTAAATFQRHAAHVSQLVRAGTFSAVVASSDAVAGHAQTGPAFVLRASDDWTGKCWVEAKRETKITRHT